jgi:hypothetical protein
VTTEHESKLAVAEEVVVVDAVALAAGAVLGDDGGEDELQAASRMAAGAPTATAKMPGHNFRCSLTRSFIEPPGRLGGSWVRRSVMHGS